PPLVPLPLLPVHIKFNASNNHTFALSLSNNFKEPSFHHSVNTTLAPIPRNRDTQRGLTNMGSDDFS
ncbi:MAG: hypothetical protein ACPGUX_04145, partial [Halocynthiibacter sp.]